MHPLSHAEPTPRHDASEPETSPESGQRRERKQAGDIALSRFEALNGAIFDEALPVTTIRIVRMAGIGWGACSVRLDPVSGDPEICAIELCERLFSKFDGHAPLDTILSHEMIHVHQWMVQGPEIMKSGRLPKFGHGPDFFWWKPVLARYGYPLKRGYSRAELERLDRRSLRKEADTLCL